MSKRLQLALVFVSVLLAVLAFYQLTRLFRVQDPLAALALPDLSVLSIKPRASSTGDKTNTAAASGRPSGPASVRGPRGAPSLSPEIQNQVDTIEQSEIMGMIPRPRPLLLLGIAGADALLQTSSGQSGLVPEGGELGGVKVLRIGTNRVLVEVEGRAQELVLFPGLPGESLMPKNPDPRP